MTEGEMVGLHHRLNGHEFEQTLGAGEGQGSLVCCSPGFLVFHYLLEFAQTHIHHVDNAIQPSHPLSPSSPSALNPSQHQLLFQ